MTGPRGIGSVRGRFAAALATLRQGGLGALRPASVPMRTVLYGPAPDTDRLLLLLPGRHDSADSFGRYGFPEAAREAGLRAEIAAADAHLGYYARRAVHTRLHEDVLAPARARGRRRVWLAGISLGGLGSGILASEVAEQVEGMILIAPYLGPDSLVREIGGVGGLRAWSPPPAPQGFPRLWAWLRGYDDGRDAKLPTLILAYGEDDRYRAAHRLLAAVLPPSRVLVLPGGHDWPTWLALWRDAVRHPLVQHALGERAAEASAP
jgi:hypothetical protein